jgi:hypothetical protein
MIGEKSVTAESAAKILYFYVVGAEGDRLRPGEFFLPDSIADNFKTIAALYLEASMLLVLKSLTDEHAAYADILTEFQQLSVIGLNESERAKHVVNIVEAFNEIQLLYSQNDRAWRETGFATKWLARIGVVRFLSSAQPGPFTSMKLTDYWMNIPLIMRRSALKLMST